MSDGTGQALQRFLAALIAELAPILIAFASSEELRRLILDSGLPATLIAILLILAPPIILGIAKAMHGPTESPEPTPAERDEGRARSRRRVVPGQPPGLFG